MLTHDKSLDKIEMLVVDDQPEEIAGTLTTLRRKGATIMTAKDVQTAELLLKERDFDVAMIDMRLPTVPQGDLEEEGGKQLIEDLHSGNLGMRNRDIPFLIVTAQKRSIRNYELRQHKTCVGVFGKLMHTRIVSELSDIAEALGKNNQ